MKFFFHILIFTKLLLSPLAYAGISLNLDKSYISAEMYFWKAYDSQFPGIQLNQIESNKDFDSYSDQQRQNFLALLSQVDPNGDNYESNIWNVTLKVDPQSTESDQIKSFHCLGYLTSIFENLPPTEAEKLEELKDRTGFIYMSQCFAILGEEKKLAPVNYEIKHYQAFPLDKHLPLSNGELKDLFLIHDNLEPKKFFRCIDSDTNAHMQPRSAMEIFETQNHIVIRNFTATSSISDDGDLGVNFGALDLDSLGWAKDNIEFLQNLDGRLYFAFEKENCAPQFLNDQLVSLSCDLKAQPRSTFQSIESVELEMYAQLRSDLSAKKSPAPRVVYHFTILIRTNDGEEKGIYRYDFEYENSPSESMECQQKPPVEEPLPNSEVTQSLGIEI